MLSSSACCAWIVFGGAFGVGCSSDDNEASETQENTEDSESTRVHGLTPEEAAQPLATIGERTITVGEFAADLASKGSFIRARYNSPERRREFLDQMIRFELLAQAAAEAGFEDLPEVQRTRKQMMIRRFLKQRFEGRTPESITDEEVREYYDSHESEFHSPAQVRASHIQMSDRAAAQRVLSQIQENPNDLRLFRRLAEEHNQDSETAERFGDLRFFSRTSAEARDNEESVPNSVREAAFAMESIGSIAPELVRSEAGYHVVKLTGRRAEMHRSLEEATRPIRNRLHREQREAAIQALLDRLRSEADVEQNTALLEEVRLQQEIHVDMPEGGFPQMPRGPGGHHHGAHAPVPPAGPAHAHGAGH